MQPIFKITFLNIREIRMGSPFHICDVELIGKIKPKIEVHGYQDIYCWSSDNRFLALVRWNHIKNDPGFNLCVIDCEKNKVQMSERIEGCCKYVEYSNGYFNYISFNVKGDVKGGVKI